MPVSEIEARGSEIIQQFRSAIKAMQDLEIRYTLALQKFITSPDDSEAEAQARAELAEIGALHDKWIETKKSLRKSYRELN